MRGRRECQSTPMCWAKTRYLTYTFTLKTYILWQEIPFPFRQEETKECGTTDLTPTLPTSRVRIVPGTRTLTFDTYVLFYLLRNVKLWYLEGILVGDLTSGELRVDSLLICWYNKFKRKPKIKINLRLNLIIPGDSVIRHKTIFGVKTTYFVEKKYVVSSRTWKKPFKLL